MRESPKINGEMELERLKEMMRKITNKEKWSFRGIFDCLFACLFKNCNSYEVSSLPKSSCLKLLRYLVNGFLCMVPTLLKIPREILNVFIHSLFFVCISVLCVSVYVWMCVKLHECAWTSEYVCQCVYVCFFMTCIKVTQEVFIQSSCHSLGEDLSFKLFFSCH